MLTFSGGGTRAASFAYGVLEVLRRTNSRARRATAPPHRRGRRITGVSGGSFTALAYGLYGDALFADRERAS